jgi:hypothetical protein
VETAESWFHRRATYYVEAQVLFHLNQAGVLKLLSGDGAAYSTQEIANTLGLRHEIADVLLDYVLHVDELLERDETGRYKLSAFGREVVSRFSRVAEGDRPAINMFDVRVGAYGPVWGNLGRMLSGEWLYGTHFHRDGEYAEHGVSKLAGRFWNSLLSHVRELEPRAIVEVGLTTGLLEHLGESDSTRALYGLDKSRVALTAAAASASAKGLQNVRWLLSDFYDTEVWCPQITAEESGMIFSLHIHELLAAGEQRFVETLRMLRTTLPGWVLLAFEQPRLPLQARATTPEPLWLYSQSNILIHHLIGNGRILSESDWLNLGHRAGCRRVTNSACDYLGYQGFAFHF